MTNRSGGKQPSDAGGRMTKAERKEAARIERERLQRQMERQKRTRLVAIVAGVIVVALVIGAIVVLQPESQALADPADLLEQAPAAIETAGCGEIRTVAPYDPEDLDRAHIGSGGVSEMPPLDTYPSTPPASGPHNAVPLPAAVYDSPIPIDQAIHSLEHGAAIVWYDETATGQQLDELKRFYDEQIDAGAKVIVSPYDYPDQGAAGRLPDRAQMSLVAWHSVRDCAQVNLAASFDFVSQYSTPPLQGRDYLGVAPEPTAGI